jgi:hypothetical protein
VEANIAFQAKVDCLNSAAIPFDQNLEICERLKDEIFTQIFGHMPRTCLTIRRHLKSVEQELRQNGQTLLANKLSSSRALVDSLYEQMIVSRPEFDPNLAHEGGESANR